MPLHRTPLGWVAVNVLLACRQTSDSSTGYIRLLAGEGFPLFVANES